jgi:hypothetical protein
MRILLINDNYFLASFIRAGYQVFTASPAHDAQYRTEIASTKLEDVLRHCPFEPDLIVVSDSINIRTVLLGMHQSPAPIVFYGVDAPMNRLWQRDYAHSFDLAFFDQKVVVDELKSMNSAEPWRFHWLPLAADFQIFKRLDLPKKYDLSFVGSINENIRPKRSWILKELQAHFNISIFNGSNQRTLLPDEVARIYNQSKVVLNENLFPGINLRTFEAMACGTCVLNEESDHSWEEIFRDFEHLITFNPINLTDRVHQLLSNDSLVEQISAAGSDLVMKSHTIDHRVARLLEICEQFGDQAVVARDLKKRRYHLGKAFLALSNRWKETPLKSLKNEGISLLLELLKNQWESADMHSALGAEALGESRRSDALNSFQRALQIESQHLRSRWGLFWCLWESGDSSGAAEELKKLSHHLRMRNRGRTVFRHITTSSTLTFADYLYLGELAEKAGWEIEPGIDRTLSHPCTWNAFDLYQKAIQCDPKQGAPYVRCTELLIKNQLPEFAIFTAHKAVAILPWDSELRLILGNLLLTSYRRKEGLSQIVQFLIRSNDSEKWERIIENTLTDVEWLTVLNQVWDNCQEEFPLSSAPNGVLKRMADFIPQDIVVHNKLIL